MIWFDGSTAFPFASCLISAWARHLHFCAVVPVCTTYSKSGFSVGFPLLNVLYGVIFTPSSCIFRFLLAFGTSNGLASSDVPEMVK